MAQHLNDSNNQKQEMTNVFTLPIVCQPRWHHLLLSAVSIGLSAIAAASIPDIAASKHSSFAIDASGRLFSWGEDTEGQLGLGRNVTRTAPDRVVHGEFVSVFAGWNSNFGITAGGALWAWGKNEQGQLGDGTLTNRSEPVLIGQGYRTVSVGVYDALAIKTDGSLWGWGGNYQSLVPKKLGDGYVSVSCGNSRCFAIKSDTTLWATGWNPEGELGTGDTKDVPQPGFALVGTGFREVSSGIVHTLAVKTDNSLWAWGFNNRSQLGDGSTATRLSPIQIGTGFRTARASYEHSFAVKQDGTLWAWGLDQYGGYTAGISTSSTTPVQVGSGVKDLATGDYHTMILKTDGSLWSAGNNEQGQLGVVTPAFYQTNLVQVGTGFVAIAAGATHSLGLKDTGTFAWGNNNTGQLGDGVPSFRTVPTLVGEGYRAVVSAETITFAVKSDNSLWAWGRGYLGNGVYYGSTSSPVKIGDGYRTISASPTHSLAVKTDNTLWAWGQNNYGQLGTGITNDYLVPTKVGEGYQDAVASWGYSFFLKPDGSLWSVGYNRFGQLADGTEISRDKPFLVGTNFKTVASAYNHAAATKQDGTLWTWGLKLNGAQDDNPANHLTSPLLIGSGYKGAVVGNGSTYAFKLDGSIWGSNNYFWGGYDASPNSNQLLPLGSDYVRLAVGYQHLVALKADGSGWASSGWDFGHSLNLNGKGELGNGTVAVQPVFGPIVNATATDYFSAYGKAINPGAAGLAFFLTANPQGGTLTTTLTDPRATGFDGDIYFTALLPANSPLLPKAAANGFADTSSATIPVSLGRGGVKQTGPGVPGTPAASGTGTITAGNSFAVWTGAGSDPLAGNNAVVCMGVTVPALSAKGQVLMRPIANGSNPAGVTQCPTVQTPATTELYKGTASGTLSNLTLNANITPQSEDRGQVRNVYSWAIAQNGQQYMQTTNGWALMSEPMQPAATVTVPAAGDVSLIVLNGGIDLTSLKGTLVYVGMGSSWQEVKQLNKAGHYYTLQ